ncbi:hypothetical protein A3A50_04550 [Candidatus Woesebacteria bacterium RIFCSPLOWO2_01_FULL_38_20]|nr:MAG: hypothetical protein A3A50_04550 [Candidatus Woesebacteria bacterium RIFCSPLOWO2_01_FULL_38_20]
MVAPQMRGAKGVRKMTAYKLEMKKNNSLRDQRSGFTLIELLIVIAVLGVLAVVILVGLNPLEQLRKTRDAGRVSGVAQIGHALEAFITSNNGLSIPAVADVPAVGTWLSFLQTQGELSIVPGAIPNPTNAFCAVVQVNGWCYRSTLGTGGVPVMVFSRLEAQANINRCTTLYGATYDRAYAGYATAQGRGGILCTAGATEPVLGTYEWL